MKIIKLFLLFVSLQTTSIIEAQNFIDILRLSQKSLGTNSRSLGLGESYIALSDDFSAVNINPAGLGLIKRFSFSGNIGAINSSVETSFFNNKNKVTKNNSELEQLGFVFPFPTFRGSLVFALGYQQHKNFDKTTEFDGFNKYNNSFIQTLTQQGNRIPYELGLSYEVLDSNGNWVGDETLIEGRLNQSGSIVETGDISGWMFSSALEVAENMFLGATINFYSGEYIKERIYTEEDIANYYDKNLELIEGDKFTRDFQKFRENDILNWNISGFDLKLGWLYQINRNIRIGATIKSPSFFKIKEKYKGKAYSYFDDAAFQLTSPINNQVEYNIRTPFEYSFGVAGVLRGILLSGELTLLDYTKAKFTKGLSEKYQQEKNTEIKNILRTTLDGNVGIEYTFSKINFRVRSGFIYKQSPFKNDPSEYDRKYFTAGIGFLIARLTSIDIGFAHGWWKNYQDNYGNGQSRYYQNIKKNKFLISVTWKF